MEEHPPITDGFQWLYTKYIGDDPERLASFQEELVKAEIASRIYAIRTRLRMSRDDLAEFSGLNVEAIEDLEESDYDGSWDEAVEAVNRGFHRWIDEVVLPASRMIPEEYSVRIAPVRVPQESAHINPCPSFSARNTRRTQRRAHRGP